MTAQRPTLSVAIPTFERGQFRKSTRSGQDPQRCVEVARADGWVAVRDSKQPWNSTSDHRLVFTGAQFDSWIASLRTESAGTGCIEITRSDSGTNEFRSTVTQAHGHHLEFTEAEVAAFLDGARDGEFTEPAPHTERETASGF
jgi:uncharacterized protein DUF397